MEGHRLMDRLWCDPLGVAAHEHRALVPDAYSIRRYVLIRCHQGQAVFLRNGVVMQMADDCYRTHLRQPPISFH
jgi:hypothetical protein